MGWTVTAVHALSFTHTWNWNKQDCTHYTKSLPVRFDVEPFLLRLGLKTPSCMSTPPPTPPLSTWIVFGRGREPVDVLFRILGTGFVEARSTLSGRSLPYITENVHYFATHGNAALSTLQTQCHQSQHHNCYFYWHFSLPFPISLINSNECIMKSCLSVGCSSVHLRFKSSNTWQIFIKYKIKIMLQKVASNCTLSIL